MIKKVFLSLALGSLSSLAYPCELPKNEVLKVGCSSDCDLLYRFRLMMTSWSLGYKTKVIDLYPSIDLKASMEQVDAILLPGGADIDPSYYLSEVTPELRKYTEKNLHLVNFTREGKRRDPFEYNLLKIYSEDRAFEKKPLLGICRGLQMMSVAQGIPLYLDIKTELGIKNRRNLFDRVSISKTNSLMNDLYTKENIKGFKLHHQGIRVSYYEAHEEKFPLTKITAYSNDRKIAEAIEYTHRPALGVQFHPERSFPGTSAPVFRWFLTKACEHKTSKGI